MGKLTTHVLDLRSGKPAANMRIRLQRLPAAGNAAENNALDQVVRPTLGEFHTNLDGRLAAPLLEATALQVGRYRLLFDVAGYFRAQGVTLAEPPFLDEVSIDFGIAAADQHYHVPLLVTPWSYSTYRGS